MGVYDAFCYVRGTRGVYVGYPRIYKRMGATLYLPSIGIPVDRKRHIQAWGGGALGIPVKILCEEGMRSHARNDEAFCVLRAKKDRSSSWISRDLKKAINHMN